MAPSWFNSMIEGWMGGHLGKPSEVQQFTTGEIHSFRLLDVLFRFV